MGATLEPGNLSPYAEQPLVGTGTDVGILASVRLLIGIRPTSEAASPASKHHMPPSKSVTKRIQSGLKTLVPIIKAQCDRDVSEADTVTVVKDVLADVFGYDKYTELTGELCIRGTFCDLAIQFDGKFQLLIEVKAIGMALQDRHVKQAIDYGANQGIEWVVLTNGAEWVLYHILFRKPIDKEEVVRFNLLEINPRKSETLDTLYLLTREGLRKDALEEYRTRQDATNRFLLSAILLNSEGVLRKIRTEVRRTTEILVSTDEIAKVLREQVLKRETLEGEQSEAAEKKVGRRADRSIVKKAGAPRRRTTRKKAAESADSVDPK